MAEDVIGERTLDRGEPAVRTLAMPADTNPSGDIFGGWVLAQMDLAAGIVAAQCAKGRVATITHCDRSSNSWSDCRGRGATS